MYQELPVRPPVNNPAIGVVDTDLALSPASTTKLACSAIIDAKLLVRRLTEAARRQPKAVAAVASPIVKGRSPVTATSGRAQ